MQRSKQRRKAIVGSAILFTAVALYNYAFLLGSLSFGGNEYMIDGDWMELVGATKKEDTEISAGRGRDRWSRLINSNQSLVGVHVFRPHTPIDRIHLIGERHSGTTYFTQFLQQCFPNLVVSDVLVNGKHWRQPTPTEVEDAVRKMGGSHDWAREMELLSWWDLQQRHSKMMEQRAFQSSLVVALFRDPYQW